jgi:hypothetical protein
MKRLFRKVLKTFRKVLKTIVVTEPGAPALDLEKLFARACVGTPLLIF